MKLLSLTCHGCGAPLDAPASASQVECEYCASKFTVDGSQVGSIKQVAAEPPTEPDPPEVAELKQKLHTLDLEWVQRKARYVTISIDGRFTVPDVDYCRMGQLASAVLIAAVLIVAYVAGSISLSLIGVPIMMLGFFGFSKSLKKALAYRKNYDKYRTERLQLLVKLDEATRETAAV
jgi:LSD1 subclass zinc finger protein